MAVDGGARAKTQDTFVAALATVAVVINIAATTTLYTVPAGKVFVGSVYVVASTAVTAGSLIGLAIAGNNYLGVTSVATNNGVTVLNPVTDIRLAAGTALTVKIGAAIVGTGSITCTVFGEERFVE